MSKRFSLIAVLATMLTFAAAHDALAEKRVALVLGMSKYQNVPALTNPARDAAAMGEVFKKAGFDVVDMKLDLTVSGLRREVRDFASAAADADIAVVYYAGHGIEVDGTNYLIPADARLVSDFAARKIIYEKMTAQILEDEPIIYLYHRNVLIAHTAKLEGYTQMPDGLVRVIGLKLK